MVQGARRPERLQARLGNLALRKFTTIQNRRRKKPQSRAHLRSPRLQRAWSARPVGPQGPLGQECALNKISCLWPGLTRARAAAPACGYARPRLRRPSLGSHPSLQTTSDREASWALHVTGAQRHPDETKAKPRLPRCVSFPKTPHSEHRDTAVTRGSDRVGDLVTGRRGQREGRGSKGSGATGGPRDSRVLPAHKGEAHAEITMPPGAGTWGSPDASGLASWRGAALESGAARPCCGPRAERTMPSPCPAGPRGNWALPRLGQRRPLPERLTPPAPSLGLPAASTLPRGRL